MEEAANSPGDLTALRRRLARLDAHIEQQASVCAASLGELRRQHKAIGKRRGGSGSRDARRYALGATLAMVGAGEVEDTALLGLMAHPVRMLRWMAQALEQGAGPTFGDIVGVVLADPDRRAWCEHWGRILRWREQKRRYDAAVTNFLASGRTGPGEAWRREPATDDQAALIATLAALLDEPTPDITLRGPAFEWILVRGGNPSYWREPTLPPQWEERA